MAQQDVSWLVKSSGRVIGPFSYTKIVELLRTREISVLDEVAPALRRWQTIQYHPAFKEVVDGLRKANLSEKTEATWTPGGMTSNLTQTVTDVSDLELTDEISNVGLGFGHGASEKEIVIHELKDETRTASNSSPGGVGRFQTQGAQSTAIQRQVEKTTRGLWFVTLAVLLVAGIFILQKRWGRNGIESKSSLASLKQSVMASIQTGQYADALRDLKAFYPNPNLAGEMAIYYGSLLVQVEGQTSLGRQLLTSVISSRRPEAKQAYTGLSVADLIEGQLDAAQENLDRALGLDPSYVPALVNSAAVALQKGDFARARTLSLNALRVSPSQGETVLILAQAQLQLYKKNASAGDLPQVNRTVKNFIAKNWDYYSELGLFSLYFDFLSHDKKFEENLVDYLDHDPQLTADHRHNVFIFTGPTHWKTIGQWCAELIEKLDDGPRVAVLRASCYGHEMRWDQARRQIEKAVQQNPKDALTQAWFSYVLKESREGDQASVVLGRATEFNRRGEFVLPQVLQARFCATLGDTDCARESWQRIYEKNLDYLPAVSGLAWVKAQSGAHAEARKLMEKGLKISPDYIPLLQLRQRGEKEGWN